MKTFNDAIHTVLTQLCESVGVIIPELSDDFTISSDTALKLLFKHPIHEVGQVINGAHTDFGPVTLLWYDEETTQILVRNEDDKDYKDEGDWQTIPVIEGCVLVNVADELAAKSNGGLHSTVHRVIAPPGPKRVRNGIVYFLRPYI